jgi:hypothetical protein
MRVKTTWFKEGREKSPQEIAAAMAFIAWRVVQNTLKNLRRADFDIAVGPQYFGILTEALIFVVQLADRIAYRRMGAQARAQFTTELANRAASNLAENQHRLLGLDEAVCKAEFIRQLNDRADDYAAFEYEPAGSNFAISRCFAHALTAHLEEKDHHWVSDQIIAIESPEAAATLEKAMSGLLDTAPRPRRAGSNNGAD